MAGAGYKLFNTGDVLTAAQVNTYLMEQTVMVFADAAARTTALTGVVSEGMISYLKDTNAVEVYNGSAWVSSDDPNAIQNTIVDAKGDLISATAADTPARLAVGNNGETLVADSSATTGLRWNPSQAAGKNYIINGGFDIWQRGTSFTSAGYTADRFYGSWTGTVTLTRQTSGAPNGSRYYVRQTAGANNSIVDFAQMIETDNVAQLWGRTVTLSFKIRRNATLTQDFAVYVQKNSTADAGFGTAGWTSLSGSPATISNALIPTGTTSADWYTYTGSFSVPNDGTANSLRIILEPNAQMSNGAVFDLAQIQLEIGSTATTFTRTGGTLAGELAACQRYYQRISGGNDIVGSGQWTTTTSALIVVPNKVTMRTAPAISATVTNFNVTNSTGGAIVATAVSGTVTGVSNQLITVTTAGSGSGGNGTTCFTNGANGILEMSSEL